MVSGEFDRRRSAIEDRITGVLDATAPPELAEQMVDATLAGGKRVRPTLTLLMCEATGGDPDADRTLDFAAGIELVHTASLIVDDIIDRSTVRRGEASAWASIGHSAAIVTTNGLLGEAFALFSAKPEATEAVTDALVELGEGEASELVAEPSTEAEYLELARRKTGALFRAAAELGAIAADADPETIEGVGVYAEHLGVAFQLRDDVLDATAESGTLGKPAGRDAAMDRPSILQVTDREPEGVTAIARAEADEAIEAIGDVDLPRKDVQKSLEELAVFVVERER